MKIPSPNFHNGVTKRFSSPYIQYAKNVKGYMIEYSKVAIADANAIELQHLNYRRIPSIYDDDGQRRCNSRPTNLLTQ